MKKNSIIILIILASVNNLFSQQSPALSEYYFNPFIINSAFSGITPQQITLSHNGTFGGVQGAPSTTTLTYTNTNMYSKTGYGFGIMNDEIGVTKSTHLYGAFSYRIEFDNASYRGDWEIYDMNVISFGLTAGVQLFREDLLDLNINNDINFQQNINVTIPTIGAGIMYNKGSFFLGLSSPNLIGTSLANVDNVELSSQFYSYLGFRFYTSKFEKLLLKPSILFKTESGSPSQIDFNISALYNNKVEFGIGYRTTSSISGLIALKTGKSFKIMYSYNNYFSNAVNGSTHGFGLSYRFKD